MAFLPEDILPAALRGPGEYTSCPLWVPPDATYVTIAQDSRSQWQRLGVGTDVLELRIEINVNGRWETLGGCTTDASRKLKRDGSIAESTTLCVPLPRQRHPQPQVRGVLKCYSQCEGALVVLFDDRRQRALPLHEHHSVTYDNDGEAVGAAVASVTIGAFTVGNNANRAMLVGVARWDASLADSLVSAITHNGSTDGWSEVILRTDSSNDRASISRKIAPAAVASTVIVTMGGVCGELGANALSVYDVDQTTPTAGATGADGTADPITVAVSAATGDLVYDVAYHYGTSTTYILGAGASQTPRANVDIIDYPIAEESARLAASTAPGATTVTMSWTATIGTTTYWCQVACAIKAAGTGLTRYPFRQRVWRIWRS